MPGPQDDPLIAATFLEAVTQDRAEGREVHLEGYLARFPGHEDQIRREWEALQGDDPAPAGARRIAHYELLEVLGRGGQGIVHRARDLRLGREVALKILRGSQLPTPESLERFRREAEVAARLDHPGICRILDTGVDAGTTYIAMQLVPGRSLADEIAAGESPPDTRAEFERWAQVFALAARALHAAHSAGVVHRDVKPGNIMVTGDDQAVVLDFGLARDEEGMDLTRTGDVFGTPAYMAPEQLEGDPARIGPACDVYGLGATLFECLTWRPPFTITDGQGIYRSILDREAPSPQAFHRAVPHDLAVLTLTALAKSPTHRYPSALAMAEDLERFVRREPLRARPVGPLERSWRWARANPVVAGLAAALFLVLGTSVLLLGSQNRQLTEALEDARAGRASKQEREVAALVRDGYQRLFSVNSRGADALFDRALDLAPDNRTALIGRVWFDVMRPATARAALDRHVPESSTDPDALWLRGVALELIGSADEARATFDRVGDRPDSHLRCYLRGLSAAKGFMTGEGDAAKVALPWFEKAILRAPAPRFAYYHSQLMAASIAGDGATQDRAAELLEHHWGDAPATLEAIAQFYMGRDPKRAETALRRLMEQRPTPSACCGLAHLAQQREDPAAARAWLDRGVDLPEANAFAPIWHLRAQVRVGDDPSGAVADLRRCLTIDAAFFPAALQLATLLHPNDNAAATEVLRTALDALEPGAPGRAAVEAALRRSEDR